MHFEDVVLGVLLFKQDRLYILKTHRKFGTQNPCQNIIKAISVPLQFVS